MIGIQYLYIWFNKKRISIEFKNEPLIWTSGSLEIIKKFGHHEKHKTLMVPTRN